jgi:hypothetical protein
MRGPVYYEYRECLECEYIEDCPHPLVDLEGNPIPPTICNKKDDIKLMKRVEDLIPKE